MIRDKKWKYTEYPHQESVERGLPIDHYLKNTDFFEGDLVDGELYDMENDPYEMYNLYNKKEFHDIRNRYSQKLMDWKNRLGPLADYSEHRVEKNQLGFYKQITADNISKLNRVPLEGKFHGRSKKSD